MKGPRPGKPGPKPKPDSTTDGQVKHIKLPMVLIKRLEERARKERISVAQVIRNILWDALR